MSLNLRQPVLLLAELTLNTERADDFSDDTRSPTDSNVFVTHWAVLIQDQPVLDASLAK